MALRFSVGDDVDDGDVVYVDNVKLSYATTAVPTQTINYTENSAVGILPPQITDVDNNATIYSATVTITTNHQANDLLSVTGSLPGGITASSIQCGDRRADADGHNQPGELSGRAEPHHLQQHERQPEHFGSHAGDQGQ